MEEIASFMDEVVISEDENIWSHNLKIQKDTIENYHLSLSELMLNEISSKDMSFQEYGINISKQHLEMINNISLKNKANLVQAAQNSLLHASDIESSQDVDFEDYLKDFLNKIS